MIKSNQNFLEIELNFTPLEKKRETYLTFYRDGIFDGLLNQKIDPQNKSSDYYKRGFNEGLRLLELVKDVYNLRAKNENKIQS